MTDYTGWVLNVQHEADPNGIDVRVEPKFYLPNGEAFNGGWCRPQNEGPALRAGTMIIWARLLVENGQKEYVEKYLWSKSANGGAIKWDLDWVLNNWEADGCDLWEEVRSNDFFWVR